MNVGNTSSSSSASSKKCEHHLQYHRSICPYKRGQISPPSIVKMMSILVLLLVHRFVCSLSCVEGFGIVFGAAVVVWNDRLEFHQIFHSQSTTNIRRCTTTTTTFMQQQRNEDYFNNDIESTQESTSPEFEKKKSAADFWPSEYDYDGAGSLGDIMSKPRSTTATRRRIQRSSKGLNVTNDEDLSTVFSSLSNDSSLSENEFESLSFPKTTTTETAETAAGVVPPSGKEEQPSTVHSGLVTTAGGTLQDQFGSKVGYLSPLDRIALTANGNLQRIFSSYYGSPVSVYLHKCHLVSSSSSSADDVPFMASPNQTTTDFTSLQTNKNEWFSKPLQNSLQIPSPPAVWHRKVHLSVHGQKFCTATSIITIQSKEYIQLVHEGTVDITQLFRHFGILPTFVLLDAGRSNEEGLSLWRIYELSSKGLSYRIKEEFIPNPWGLQP